MHLNRENSTVHPESQTRNISLNTKAIEFTELPEFCNDGLDSYKRNFLPQSKMRSVGTVFDFTDISVAKPCKVRSNSRRNCNSLSPSTKLASNTTDSRQMPTLTLPSIQQSYVMRVGNGFNQPSIVNQISPIAMDSNLVSNSYISCSKLKLINSRKRRRQSKRTSVGKTKIFDTNKLNDFMTLPLKIEASVSFQPKENKSRLLDLQKYGTGIIDAKQMQLSSKNEYLAEFWDNLIRKQEEK